MKTPELPWSIEIPMEWALQWKAPEGLLYELMLEGEASIRTQYPEWYEQVYKLADPIWTSGPKDTDTFVTTLEEL